MKKISFQRIIPVVYTILGALILMGVAFFNGYPVVMSDTSTYIASGFTLQPPFDRPITYGIFIIITSFGGYSLWNVIFLQSLILSFLILLTVKHYSDFKDHKVAGIVIIVILTIFSSISWLSGQVITDVFHSVSLLALFHLIFNDRLSKSHLTLLYIIYFLSNAMHLAYLPVNLIILIIILIFRKQLSDRELINKVLFRRYVIITILTVLGIGTMNTAIAKSKHAFFMGRLAESGILYQFLQENCEENDYELCRYKDSLPNNAVYFLWEKESPLYKMGGWKTTKDEFNRIILKTFITPKYLLRHVYESVKITFKQLAHFDVGSGNGPYVGKTELFSRIKKYFPYEWQEYSYSKQNKDELIPLDRINFLYRIFYGVALISGIIMLKRQDRLPNQKGLLIIFIMACIFINAWFSASLSNVALRYGARLVWLLPFGVMLLGSYVIPSKRP